MKTHKNFLGILLLLICIPAASNAKEHQVRYRMQVFRISGNFSSKLSLEDSIWRGSKEDWDRIKDSVQLFDKGTFQLGKDKLEINDRGCFWNSKQLSFGSDEQKKLPSEKIKMIYSPNIVRKSKQPVHMKLSSEQPFQYMNRKEDGFFELLEMSLPVGLDIHVCTENKKGDFFLVSSLELILRTVTERERIPGVALPIGRPLLHTSEYSLRMYIEEDKNYGILLRLPGSGVIIIRMELDDE
jgi:hypothetical protein